MSSSHQLTSDEGQQAPTRPLDLFRPRVSVIIPCYNHAHFIREAIGSVLSQNYNDYEIIVVDDGSTDNTRNVVSSFKEQVRYFGQENQGLSAARNTGLRAAKGEMIGLLDADDLYEPTFLEEMVSVLKANQGLDGVYCSAQTVDQWNKPLPQIIGRVVPPEELHGTLLKGGFFPPLCMFTYKYCFEELGFFDRALQGAADWDMWLRISMQYKIIGHNKVLTRYRIVSNSMSHDPIHMQADRALVLHKHFARESNDGSLWTPAYREALAYSHLRGSIEFLQSGNQDCAYKNLKKSFSIKPDVSSNRDIFFRLGLSSQPLGHRGDFSTLDVVKNARLLINWLDKIFQDPNLPSELKRNQRLAYANAYWAFGLLSYGKGDCASARRYLRQAIAVVPRYLINISFMSTLARSLLPAALVNWIRNWRKAHISL